jgi:hypothetical protein
VGPKKPHLIFIYMPIQLFNNGSSGNLRLSNTNNTGNIGLSVGEFAPPVPTPTPTPSGTTFSQLFTQGVAPTSTMETAWNTFRASLTGTYTTFRFFSNLNAGITVTDAVKVQTLANSLRTATVTNQTIGANTWFVGTGCGTPKIGGVAVEFSNVGSCTGGSTYSLRPMINNNNWGGVNGTTVNAPTQTITLTFS